MKIVFSKILNKRPLCLGLLLLIPLATYLLSYLYLAMYHENPWILNTVIHEGGTHSFLETMFYASHFLGHIHVYVVLALWFAGCYLCLTKPDANKTRYYIVIILISFLILYVLTAFIFSRKIFGEEETLAFISQQKQSMDIYRRGGSWDIHLPSTLMQFLLIPMIITVTKYWFGRKIIPNFQGIPYLILASITTICLTLWFTPPFFHHHYLVWIDPRYLAHSVRELATFPLIYFSPLLYFLFRKEPLAVNINNTNLWKFIFLLSFVFMVLFLYQIVTSLSAGIGNLAQKPSFAHGGQLSILYLLSSHYFEHFMDTIFFVILCIILINLNRSTQLLNP